MITALTITHGCYDRFFRGVLGPKCTESSYHQNRRETIQSTNSVFYVNH